MQNLSNLEDQLVNNPNGFNTADCIQYLQNHKEEIGKFCEFICDFSNVLYELNNKKEEIIKEIILTIPSTLDSILIPFFKISDYLMLKNTYLFGSYIDTINKSTKKKYSMKQLSDTLAKAINPPYTLIKKVFIRAVPEVREHFEKINPDIYKVIDEQFTRLTKIINQYKKPIYIPKVRHYDTSNPRISKFGGVAPYLPSDGPINCTCGEDKLQTVFSFYIPSLPEQMRNLFPSDHEYVLVGYTCNYCYAELLVKLYTDEEIDQLVYDDVPDYNSVFNEPRTVVDWIKGEMLPGGLSESGFEMPNKHQYSKEDLYFIDEILNNSTRENAKTYLGGYPIFVQGDDSPNDHELLLEMEESEASTNLWGDCGTCQVWMTTGNNFGDFVMQYACC